MLDKGWVMEVDVVMGENIFCELEEIYKDGVEGEERRGGDRVEVLPESG